MQGSNTRMFRSEALRRYLGRNDQAILLKLTSPKKFAILWLVLGLLIICLLLAWLTKIPTYAAGIVTMVNTVQEQPAGGSEVELLVLTAPETLGQLRAGQKVFFTLGASTRVAEARVIRVEPRVFSRQEVSDRFALGSDVPMDFRNLSVVALASMETVPAGLPRSGDFSRYYKAQIETGSRPIIDLVPGIAKLRAK